MLSMSIEGVNQDLSLGLVDSTDLQNIPNNVALRLRLMRETLGISQRELAKRAGVTNSGISMIELGQVSPSIQSLERILAVIPIGLSEFFGFQTVSSIQVSNAPVDLAQTENTRPLPVGKQLRSCFIVIPVGTSNGLTLSKADICGLVVAGNMQLKSISATDLLDQGSSFYIPGYQLHQFINLGDSPLKLFLCSLAE